MTTITGIPAHALLVHAIVVLAPLDGAAGDPLRVLARGPSTVGVAGLGARRGHAGADAAHHRGRGVAVRPATQRSPILREHAERGDWMIYFSVALLVVAVALAVLHWLEGRSDKRRTVATVMVAIVALVVGVSSIVTVVRIGDAGAEAVWGRQG